MHIRDTILFALGGLVGVAGIVTTFYWSAEAGIVALLLLGLIVLLLLVLQRRQLAKLQQRSLAILKPLQALETGSRTENTKPLTLSSSKELSVHTKKIIGLLQAQQVSMELLDKRIEGLIDQITDKRP